MRQWISRAMALLLLGALVGTTVFATAEDRRAPASISFGDKNAVGVAGGAVQELVAGDLDLDGYVDLVSADGEIAAWRNDGTPFAGTWVSQTVGTSGSLTHILALADLDHDGDLDVASGNNWAAANEIQVWQNDGTPFAGTWAANAVGSTGGPHSVYGLAAADLDNDGWFDLATGDTNGQVVAWRNDSTPFAGAWSSNTVGSTPGAGGVRALAVGDLDNDGDLDLVTGDAGNQVVAWQNDNTPFSGVWTAHVVFTATAAVESLALVDLDLDGDLDLVAGCGAAEDYELTSWQNDGTPFSGSWVEQQIGKNEATTYAIAVADYDVDGDPDLVSTAAYNVSYAEVRAWENDGTPFGSTWPGSDVTDPDETAYALVAADLDKDGDPDLVTGGSASADLFAWSNARPGEALSGWTEGVQPTTLSAESIALADFDFDGWTDVAAGTTSNGLYVARGNGGYVWTQVGSGVLPASGKWTGVDWGQVNNVAGLDLVASSDGGGLRVWASAQNGAVWENISNGLPTTGGYQDVALGHIDHDGLLDVVACGKGVGVRVWEGLGSPAPYWGAQAVLSGTLDFCDVALGHIDHDGNLDIAASSCGGAGVHVWLGDGALGFTPAAPLATSGSYEAVALGDINDDNWIDLLVAPASVGGVEFWAGDGGVSWTDKGALEPTLSVRSLALDDFDRDGNLDILAGLVNGVRVWRGDGSGAWSDANNGLPTSGGYPGVAFGRIDGDALLDAVAAELGASGVHVWTPVDPPPGGWDHLTPFSYPPSSWVTSQVVTITVEVADSGSGLNVDSGEYCFSRNGGATCEGGWHPAAVSGVSGTLDVEVVTASAVPFDQDSLLPDLNQNTIQFRVQDMAGTTGASPLYVVYIDSTPPSNSSVVNSPSHVVGVWDDSTAINANWNDAFDATSGIYAYYYEVTNSPSTLPDLASTTTSGNSGVGSATSDGQSWYFHLRARDWAGHLAADAVHLGPFWVDITNPTNPPTLSSSTHTPAVWSNDPTIYVHWTAGSDGDGSGVAGYWYSWRTYQETDPTASNTAGQNANSPVLGTGNSWYFNLRTRDNVGHRATDTLHLGPFFIDTIAPTSTVSSPSVSSYADFVVSWTSVDSPAPQSGVATVDIQYRDRSDRLMRDIWRPWLSDQYPNWQATFWGVSGHVYEFRSRATDGAGNVESWPAVADSRTESAPRDFEAFAIEVTQAVQDLNNSVVLVAGKRTYVRLHVRDLDGDALDPIHASLTAWRDGVLLGSIPPNNPGGMIAIPWGPDRGVLEDSFYFDVPSSWLHGTVEFTAIVNDDLMLAESDLANNDQVVTVTFNDTPAMTVRLFDVCYEEGDTTYHVRDLDRHMLASYLRRMYPIDRLNVEWARFDPCFDGLPTSKTVNRWLRRFIRGSSDPHLRFYGLVDDGGGFMRGRARFTQQVACGPAGSDDWGWDFDGSYADWYGAHELGHTFDRRHAEFCDALLGREYPYPDGDISPTRNGSDPTALYGFDVETLAIYPPSWKELMTYCDNIWISDFTYEAIRNKMVAEDALALARYGPRAPQEYISIFGTVYTDTDQVELETFYRFNDDWVLPAVTPGDYSVRLLDAGDALLASYPFVPQTTHDEPALDSVDQEGNAGAIDIYVPWVSGTNRIAIYHGETELTSRTVSDHAPQVTLTAPNSGALTGDEIAVSWAASDADGDTLEYLLEFSADGGASWETLAAELAATSIVLDAGWVPGTAQGRFRVVASDGINTAQDESDGLVSIPNKTPLAWITSPADRAYFVPGQSVGLVAEAIDVEDGTLWDGSLVWTSSLSGTVGSGHMLHVTDLITGAHVITLTATDSGGAYAVDSLTIYVGVEPPALPTIYLPLVLRGS